ncbi:unnamed protein product, partial [Ceratitis capitata]
MCLRAYVANISERFGCSATVGILVCAVRLRIAFAHCDFFDYSDDVPQQIFN